MQAVVYGVYGFLCMESKFLPLESQKCVQFFFTISEDNKLRPFPRSLALSLPHQARNMIAVAELWNPISVISYESTEMSTKMQ